MQRHHTAIGNIIVGADYRIRPFPAVQELYRHPVTALAVRFSGLHIFPRKQDIMLLQHSDHAIQSVHGNLILHLAADECYRLAAPLQQMPCCQFSGQPVIDIDPAEMALKIGIANDDMRNPLFKDHLIQLL
ncbi:hypothetical protein DXB46_06540 [Lachnospiraceae bacterium OM04-12BH]|nr:hypothetical protein DXB46_06540 [Lachnospiraceae bacterium OM04-12BH]